MNIEHLKNGFVKLSAPNGVVFVPTETWYSEAVIKETNVPLFRNAEEAE